MKLKTIRHDLQYVPPECEVLSLGTGILCASDTTIPGGIDPWVPSKDPLTF